MVTPAVASVVLVPFPFSDLTQSKLRPALILADAGKGDWVCIQITSNPYADRRAIQLDSSDFKTGSLQRVSHARPGKLFTASQQLFRREAGVLTASKFADVRDATIALIRIGC